MEKSPLFICIVASFILLSGRTKAIESNIIITIVKIAVINPVIKNDYLNDQSVFE